MNDPEDYAEYYSSSVLISLLEKGLIAATWLPDKSDLTFSITEKGKLYLEATELQCLFNLNKDKVIEA